MEVQGPSALVQLTKGQNAVEDIADQELVMQLNLLT